MQALSLQWKRATRTALIVLSIVLMGMTNAYAKERARWDWWELCPTNVKLYYKVTDAANHKVSVVYPNENSSDPYNGYDEPMGNIIIPETVMHNGVTYTVTEIGNHAFNHCQGLTGSLSIPNTVTRIGISAFSDCTGFSGTLTLGNSLLTIGTHAFYECKFTGSLVIPNSVISVGSNAFENCTGFNGTLTLSNSLSSIGGYAFYNCNGFTGTLIIPDSVTNIGYFSFYNCSGFQELILSENLVNIRQSAFEGCTGLSGDLVIPSKVSNIYLNAFTRCGNFSSIYVCAGTPPTFATDVSSYSSVFSVSNTIPFHIPYCSINEYSSALVWSNLTNVQGHNFFVENGDWSDSNKWVCDMPTAEQDVVIAANCNMDLTAETVASVTLLKRHSLTIVPDAALTVSNTIINKGTVNNLVVEYGGQLKHNSSVAVTFQKDIAGYSSTFDNYYLIASPMTESFDATDVDGMITESPYDLYIFDQECADDNLEWRNYKSNMFETIESTVGYLYANQDGTTIEFVGTTNPSGTDIEVDLAYTEGRPFAGYNLIGNPFICEAFIDGDFLVLNDNGDNFVNGTTIMPGDAILVQADEDWQSVTFTTSSDDKNDSYIEFSIVKKDNNRNHGGLIDNTRVRFGEGRGMDKFYMNASGANIYIPENGKDRAVAYATDKNEMPVNFKADIDGTYTINADLLNVESDYLHLFDNLTGNDIDLKTTHSYTFEAKTTDYASRFRLMFAPASSNDNEESFAYMSNGTLVIDNMEEGILQVVDVAGRILSSEVINGNYGKSLNLTSGVYVLRLVNENDVKTQKIVVE